MKTFDSFSKWKQAQTLAHKKLISRLQNIVSDTGPKLEKTSKWGNGVWLKGDLPLIFIHTEADHIQFGFFAGASLSDSKGLLRGKGKQVRHIRIEGAKDIDEKAFATMIRKAVKAPSYK